MLAGYKLAEFAGDLTPTQQRWVAHCFIKEMEAKNGVKNEKVDIDTFMARERKAYEMSKKIESGKYDHLFIKDSKKVYE